MNTQWDIADIMSQCDVGIFPSRAEGWGLEILECMSMGLPVIATNCTGQTEFINDKNAFLVETDELEPAVHRPWFYGQGNWHKLGQSQKEQCIEYMKHLYKEKLDNGKLNNEEGILTSKVFSWHNSAINLIKGLGDCK